jgi:diguanylate cyclase (GGDEF)-like protein
LLLPDTSTHEAAAIADQLRRAISGNPFTPFERQESAKITISVGVATLEGKQHASFDALLERADKALYAAKRRGRNQVCSAQLQGLDMSGIKGDAGEWHLLKSKCRVG